LLKFLVDVSYDKNVIKKDHDLISKHIIQYAVNIDLKVNKDVDETEEYN